MHDVCLNAITAWTETLYALKNPWREICYREYGGSSRSAGGGGGNNNNNNNNNNNIYNPILVMRIQPPWTSIFDFHYVAGLYPYLAKGSSRFIDDADADGHDNAKECAVYQDARARILSYQTDKQHERHRRKSQGVVVVKQEEDEEKEKGGGGGDGDNDDDDNNKPYPLLPSQLRDIARICFQMTDELLVFIQMLWRYARALESYTDAITAVQQQQQQEPQYTKGICTCMKLRTKAVGYGIDCVQSANRLVPKLARAREEICVAMGLDPAKVPGGNKEEEEEEGGGGGESSNKVAEKLAMMTKAITRTDIEQQQQQGGKGRRRRTGRVPLRFQLQRLLLKASCAALHVNLHYPFLSGHTSLCLLERMEPKPAALLARAQKCQVGDAPWRAKMCLLGDDITDLLEKTIQAYPELRPLDLLDSTAGLRPRRVAIRRFVTKAVSGRLLFS